MATIKWNVKAFEQLRNSPGVRADLERRVAAIAGQLPEGYESGVEQGKTRLRGYVVTADSEAMRHEATSNAMVRALGAGRGQ